MHKVLTPGLLQFLIAKGYTHCFSKKTFVCGDANLCITLTPVNYFPAFGELPQDFDAFYNISDEPAQMAKGIEHALVLVDMSQVRLEHRFEVLFTIEK
ncbi:MAG: hypothetical protein NVSMB24_28520 [Mucilaginibacter sp.]